MDLLSKVNWYLSIIVLIMLIWIYGAVKLKAAIESLEATQGCLPSFELYDSNVSGLSSPTTSGNRGDEGLITLDELLLIEPNTTLGCNHG